MNVQPIKQAQFFIFLGS